MYDGRFDPERELDLLERNEVSVFCAPPTEYRLLVKQDLKRWRLPRLRHCVGAGEPLNPEVIHAWHEAYGLMIHDGYGQTETTLLAANLPGHADPSRVDGEAVPGPRRARRSTRTGAELAPGRDRRPRAARHAAVALPRVLEEPGRDGAACRRGEWYLTGDRARRDEDGYLWFVGRADDVIISAGYRIGPFEVESALLEHPAVVESAVVASPDPVRGEIVKAFVVLRAGHAAGDALARELQEHVKRVTAPYKYPREIEFVDEPAEDGQRQDPARRAARARAAARVRFAVTIAARRRTAVAALCAGAIAACAPIRRHADVEAALRSRQLMVPVAGVRPEDVPDTFDQTRDGGKRRHHALDILAPRGTPVVSTDDGTVLAVGASRLGGRSIYATDTEGRFIYYYAHLDRQEPGLRAGVAVVRGQVLGAVGTTGNAPRTAPHLHFQVTIRPADGRWWAGTPIDPRPFLVAPGAVTETGDAVPAYGGRRE